MNLRKALDSGQADDSNDKTPVEPENNYKMEEALSEANKFGALTVTFRRGRRVDDTLSDAHPQDAVMS